MSDQPDYMLYFRPKGRLVLRDFFNAYGGLFQLLVRPPETRHASFGMRIPATPLLKNAEYWELYGQEVLSGRTRRLRVYVDGSVIFRAPADASFLCWPKDQAERIVNPVVVADSIVSFCRLIRELLQMASAQPTTGQLGVELRKAAASQPPLMMYAGKLRKDRDRFFLGPNDLHGVGERDPRRDVIVTTADFVTIDQDNPFSGADAVAYLVVKQFYNVFGFEEADIPYVDRTAATPLISVQAFGQ